MQGFRIIGHRGWGPTHNLDMDAEYPENTMMAFHHAMEQHADGIEIDVLLSKDGVPVIIHDRHLENHVAPDQVPLLQGRKVADFTFAELRGFDLGQGQTIPSLAEVIEFVRQGYPKAIINLDVKDINLVDPILNEIGKYSGAFTDPNIVISSYDWELLKLFRERDRNVSLVPAVKSALLFGPENVNPENYLPLVDTYKAEAKDAIFALREEIGCIAFDCAVTDLKDSLIEWAGDCQVGLQISTSNSRVGAEQTNYALLQKLKTAAQQTLPFVICKVDEPGPVKQRLAEIEYQQRKSQQSARPFGFFL